MLSRLQQAQQLTPQDTVRGRGGGGWGAQQFGVGQHPTASLGVSLPKEGEQ